jgi:hypothetical protein
MRVEKLFYPFPCDITIPNWPLIHTYGFIRRLNNARLLFYYMPFHSRINVSHHIFLYMRRRHLHLLYVINSFQGSLLLKDTLARMLA